MVTIARRQRPGYRGSADFLLASRVEGDEGLVSVTGELDLTTAPRVRTALMEAIGAGGKDLVVNLVGVTFLDSTALGVLVAGLKRAREAGGDLRLVATSSHILRMLAITRLDCVFSVYADVASARAAPRPTR
jgi:anti-sigma B factor antagonist